MFKIHLAVKRQKYPIPFDKDNINAMDSKGEVLLTTLVSLTQHESWSLSQHVKFGLKYRYQQG